MLIVAKGRLGGRADLRRGDSEHLPWEANSFDVVTCTDSFHHYPNPRGVLGEFRRVINSRGKVVIADVWAPSPLRQFGNLLIPLGKSGDTRIYSKQEMQVLMAGCGLSLIIWQRTG